MGAQAFAWGKPMEMGGENAPASRIGRRRERSRKETRRIHGQSRIYSSSSHGTNLEQGDQEDVRAGQELFLHLPRNESPIEVGFGGWAARVIWGWRGGRLAQEAIEEGRWARRRHCAARRKRGLCGD
jgi:hypothetical protein